MYLPYPREQFEKLNPDWWFQELAKHISVQAESQPFVPDLGRIAQLPREVSAIYFLWQFTCEVGGNGIEAYLVDSLGIYAPHAHAALCLVGASELVERLEAGIPHAFEYAEFVTKSTDSEWFRQFQPNPKYPTLQSVDIDIYDLANDGIRDKCNAFIQENRAIFVA